MKTLSAIRVTGLMTLLVLAACAGIQAGSGVPRAATAQVDCPSSECDAYWRRTQSYAATHSSYRLRMVTDVVIETEGPSGQAPEKLAFGAVRDPGSIRLIVGCLTNLGLIGAAFVPPCEREGGKPIT